MSSFTEENLNKTASRLGLDPSQMPRNVAIIMDGNGRWAQQKKKPRIEGHRRGGKTVEKMALAGVDLGFESMTLYAFSTENWKRPQVEIAGLMYLYTEYLVGIRPMMMKNKVRLFHIGNVEGLPESLKKQLAKSIEMTKENEGMVLGLALNYGSRVEIVTAVRRISQEYKSGEIELEDIDENCISRHLCTAGLNDPDLLIRTANEQRLSNFLLWQISYAEFYVTRILWPDFKKKDLEEAILEYTRRQRRFGAVKGND